MKADDSRWHKQMVGASDEEEGLLYLSLDCQDVLECSISSLRPALIKMLCCCDSEKRSRIFEKFYSGVEGLNSMYRESWMLESQDSSKT